MNLSGAVDAENLDGATLANGELMIFCKCFIDEIDRTTIVQMSSAVGVGGTGCLSGDQSYRDEGKDIISVRCSRRLREYVVRSRRTWRD